MKHPENGWVEADITINGTKLTFAQAMTVRVALSSFAMQLTDPTWQRDLGTIATGYRAQLDALHSLIFKNQP
jgi:hypothetical protein